MAVIYCIKPSDKVTDCKSVCVCRTMALQVPGDHCMGPADPCTSPAAQFRWMRKLSTRRQSWQR